METRLEYIIPQDAQRAAASLFGFYFRDPAEARRLTEDGYRFAIVGRDILDIGDGMSTGDISLLLIVMKDNVPVDPLASSAGIRGIVTASNGYDACSSSLCVRTVAWSRGSYRGNAYLHVYCPRTSKGIVFATGKDAMGQLMRGEGEIAAGVVELDARYMHNAHMRILQRVDLRVGGDLDVNVDGVFYSV
ncbi:hypothetical protein BBP40_010727 [Aspergillus hancockii]|nr:hypothetical protein BBP40_010727 [Aspergillus hancockii]